LKDDIPKSGSGKHPTKSLMLSKERRNQLRSSLPKKIRSAVQVADTVIVKSACQSPKKIQSFEVQTAVKKSIPCCNVSIVE
jgi:hypothetical protein